MSTQWGRVTHIGTGNLTIIGSDKCLSPGSRQAIVWTNAGLVLIGPFGTNFSEIQIKIFIKQNAFESVVCEMAAILSRPKCVNNGRDCYESEWYLTGKHILNDMCTIKLC